MKNQANVRQSIIGWCLALSLVMFFSASPRAEAANNDYSHQIGSVCSLETQTVPWSPTKGGTLICLKDKSGLHWRDLLPVMADSHLDSILPSCNLERYSPPIKVSAVQLKIFTRLATDYFGKRHLLPIKILDVSKAVKKYSTVGIHVCSNGIAVTLGAWGGFMPLNATEGWLVDTLHKQNASGNSILLQMVKVGTRYKIVGAVTGP